MTSPRSRTGALLGLVALVLLPLTIVASESEPVPPDSGHALSPLALEILDISKSERETLEDLQTRFEATVDHEAALQLQQEIAHTKQATEISILRAQVRHARLAGKAEAASQIEAHADALQQRLEEKFSPRVREER